MLSAHSLRIRLVLLVGLCLAVLGGSLITFATIRASRSAFDAARARMLGTAHTDASLIQARVDHAMDAARTLAEALSTVKRDNVNLNRGQANAMLKTVLTDNPEFQGVYTAWEPDAFDGLDAQYAGKEGQDQAGRFMPYWGRDENGKIQVRSLTQCEDEGHADCYLKPRETMRECVIGPYVCPVQSRTTLIISLVAPITTDSTFHGMAGVDLRLDFLRPLADNVDVYEGAGRLWLISNNGTVAGATRQPAAVGAPAVEVLAGHENLLSLLQKKSEGTTADLDELEAIVPVQIGQTGTPWFVALEVPETRITAAGGAQLYYMLAIASVLTLAGILSAAILLHFLVNRRINRLVSVARTLAEGNYDVRSSLQGDDELSLLGKTFDNMADQVATAHSALSRSLEASRQDRDNLAASERKFHTIFDSVSDAIFIHDIETGRVVDVNDAACRMYKSTREQVLQTDMSQFVLGEPPYGPDEARQWMAKAAAGAPQVFDWLACDSQGHRFWVEVSMRRAAIGTEDRLVVTARDITERRRLLEQLQQINAELEQRVRERTAVAEDRALQLRLLASRLTMAEHQERRRIAHILHEHFQQLLAGAKFSLGVVRRKAHDEDLREPLARVERAIDESIQASRSLTVELCPPILYDMGLAAAIQWLGRWMMDKYQLKVDVTADPTANPEAEDINLLLFHSARELLFNVVKHAHVQQATIRLMRKDQHHVEVQVSDEGAGFDPSAHPAGGNRAAGFGLFSIRERLELVGGQMDVESSPGHGTQVRLVAPIRHEAALDPQAY